MNKKPELIDILFELQEEYNFDLTYTKDHEYILIKRNAADKET